MLYDMFLDITAIYVDNELCQYSYRTPHTGIAALQIVRSYRCYEEYHNNWCAIEENGDITIGTCKSYLSCCRLYIYRALTCHLVYYPIFYQFFFVFCCMVVLPKPKECKKQKLSGAAAAALAEAKMDQVTENFAIFLIYGPVQCCTLSPILYTYVLHKSYVFF